MFQAVSSVQPSPARALGSTSEAGPLAADTVLAQRDRMIAIFGHDLRGLLNALTVNADLFLRQEGETAAKSAQNIRLTVGRMDH